MFLKSCRFKESEQFSGEIKIYSCGTKNGPEKHTYEINWIDLALSLRRINNAKKILIP